MPRRGCQTAFWSGKMEKKEGCGVRKWEWMKQNGWLQHLCCSLTALAAGMLSAALLTRLRR